MSITIALSSLLLAAPAVLAQSTGSGSCTDVHIFLARGWNEQYPGRQGKLANQICSDLQGKSCDYEDIVFDAASTDYCPSVETADANGIKQINDYYAKCPNSALVLSGYSEGAQVIGDLLSGGTCADFTPLPITEGASCQIAAAMVWGDPHHQPYKAYNVLNGTAGNGSGGARSGPEQQTLDFYTPRLHSYCQYDDLICAAGLGADTVQAHTDYFNIWTEDAASWAAGLVSSFKQGQYCGANQTGKASSGLAPTGYSNATATPSQVTTVTDATTVYTTYCPVTATETNGGSTSVKTYTTHSTITSTFKSTITKTAYVTPSAHYKPSSSAPSDTCTESTMTTVGGHSAVVSYGHSTQTTTYGNFPPITITRNIPTATSVIGWNNGTVPTGTGAAKPSGSSGLGSTYPSAAVYTGAASSVNAAGWLAGAIGVAGMMAL